MHLMCIIDLEAGYQNAAKANTFLYIDKSRFDQVIRNFITNAVRNEILRILCLRYCKIFELLQICRRLNLLLEMELFVLLHRVIIPAITR